MAANMAGSLMGASLTLIVLTTVLVWMRMWVRYRLGYLGMDDYMIAASWILLVAMCSIVMTSTQLGALGYKKDDLSTERFETFLQLQPGVSATFSFGVACAKISFAILYMRIVPNRFFIRLNKILIFFLIAQAIEESLITIFQCSPIKAAYKVDVDGKCLDLHVLWWTTFVFNMSTDLILFIQPIPSIWSLQMAKVKRVGLIAMMSLGLLVCVISIIRIVFVTHIGEDISFEIAEAVIWSEVEVAALLVCSCIPSLRQVIQRIPWLNHAFGLSSNKTSEHQYKSGGNQGSIPLHGYAHQDYLPSHQRSKTYRKGSSAHFGTSSQAVAATTAPSRNDSTEEIFPHKTDGNGAILVTREVTHDVEYESARPNPSLADSFKNGEGIEPADRGG